jgi:Family of unknown function (DUF6409)
MTATTTPTAVTGDIVTAHPWSAGYELRARQGVVLGGYGDRDEYVLVWFRTMGPLTDEEIGHALQPILRSKATVTGHVAHLHPSVLRNAIRQVSAFGGQEAAALYRVLYRTLQALEV